MGGIAHASAACHNIIARSSQALARAAAAETNIALQQHEIRFACTHSEIEGCAADAHGAGRRDDLISGRSALTANPPKRSLASLDAQSLQCIATLVDEFIDGDRSIGADCQLGAIDELELANARGIGSKCIVEVDGIRRLQHPRSCSSARADPARGLHRLADRGNSHAWASIGDCGQYGSRGQKVPDAHQMNSTTERQRRCSPNQTASKTISA